MSSGQDKAQLEIPFYGLRKKKKKLKSLLKIPQKTWGRSDGEYGSQKQSQHCTDLRCSPADQHTAPTCETPNEKIQAAGRNLPSLMSAVLAVKGSSTLHGETHLHKASQVQVSGPRPQDYIRALPHSYHPSADLHVPPRLGSAAHTANKGTNICTLLCAAASAASAFLLLTTPLPRTRCRNSSHFSSLPPRSDTTLGS